MREDDEVTFGSGAFREERRRDPSRVLALTDGVFAIIITLLVLDIHVPELSAHEHLRTAIWAYATLRPSLIHEPLDRASIWSGLALSVFAITLLRLLAPRGSAERQFT